LNPPQSLEVIWQSLEQKESPGVLQRVDEDHPADFYAALDGHGRRGLVLFAAAPPSLIPELENLDIECNEQQDGRWRICIWLTSKELGAIFATLVQDVLEATRDVPPDTISEFVAVRIQRWADLLETGGSGLPLWRLRGLIAELVVLRSLFNLMTPAEAIGAWEGPLGAAQDFVFQRLRIEAKAIGPTARRVHISSADQLEAADDVALRLVVVMLAPASPDEAEGFTISMLVDDIRAGLSTSPTASREFDRRLAASGCGDLSKYGAIFRIDGIRNFAVEQGFPRIVSTSLTPGVDEVSYSIGLAGIADYEKALGD
jgi:hypothetical protein